MKQSIRDKLENLVTVSTSSTACWPAARRRATWTSIASCRASTPRSGPVVALYQQWRQTEADLEGAEMLADPEMKEFAEEEMKAAPERVCRNSRAICRSCCCRRTPTTSATSSSKSAPAPAATSRRCSPATCSACIHALRRAPALAGRGRVGERIRPRRLQGSHRRIVGNGAYSRSSSNPAATACSACRRPRRRAASTPRRAPWR
jgi:hypothetical protein